MQSLTTTSTQRQSLSTISSKGQITLPAEIRRYLNVDTNDRVAFLIDPSGEIKLTQAKYPDIKSLKGAAGMSKSPIRSFKKTLRDAREARLRKKYGK